MSVEGIPDNAARRQKDAGRDVVPPVPAIPARDRGYAAADILLEPIDVTRPAGSSTPSSGGGGGGSVGFGHANDVPSSSTGGGGTPVTWASGATDALGQIDRAIAIVSAGRAEMGATENALDHTIRSVGVSAENLAFSESQIRDADMAEEITELKRREILIQASMQMLAQANTVPQSVLKLLQ